MGYECTNWIREADSPYYTLTQKIYYAFRANVSMWKYLCTLIIRSKTFERDSIKQGENNNDHYSRDLQVAKFKDNLSPVDHSLFRTKSY